MRTVEVCLTPNLIHQHHLQGKIVVVVDILRATSCIVTGLACGVKSIRPESEIEKSLELKKEGYITAGERGGKKIESFDLGNSPLEYQQEWLKDKKIVLSTTNGSLAILKSKEADMVLIGAFLNLKALSEYILQMPNDVVIHCAGWKGTPNVEDTLFAGALVDEILEETEIANDSAILAHSLYVASHENLLKVISESNHGKRIVNFGFERDLTFCAGEKSYPVVPKLHGLELQNAIKN